MKNFKPYIWNPSILKKIAPLWSPELRDSNYSGIAQFSFAFPLVPGKKFAVLQDGNLVGEITFIQWTEK